MGYDDSLNIDARIDQSGVESGMNTTTGYGSLKSGIFRDRLTNSEQELNRLKMKTDF